MTQETLEQKAEDFAFPGKPFGVDPSMSYDRKTFVSAMNDLTDVEDYNKRLIESKLTDTGALDDFLPIAIQYMPGHKDPEERYSKTKREWTNNRHLALDQANDLLTAGYVKTAQFVENNRHKFLEELPAEKLYDLFMNAPLYQSGDEEHDTATELKAKFMQIQKAQKEGDEQSLVKLVKKEVNELINKIPKEQMIYAQRGGLNLLQGELVGYALEDIQREFLGLFKDAKGNPQKDPLIKYLERHYQVVEDAIDHEGITDGKKRTYGTKT